MQEVWLIEHESGAKWWHMQYGWVREQKRAMRFHTYQDAEHYRGQQRSRLGKHKSVAYRADDERHPSVSPVDYNPF